MINKDTILLENAYKLVSKPTVSAELHWQSLNRIAEQKFGSLENVLEILRAASKYFDELHHKALAYNQDQKDQWYTLSLHLNHEANELDTPNRIKRQKKYAEERERSDYGSYDGGNDSGIGF